MIQDHKNEIRQSLNDKLDELAKYFSRHDNNIPIYIGPMNNVFEYSISAIVDGARKWFFDNSIVAKITQFNCYFLNENLIEIEFKDEESVELYYKRWVGNNGVIISSGGNIIDKNIKDSTGRVKETVESLMADIENHLDRLDDELAFFIYEMNVGGGVSSNIQVQLN